MGTILYATKRIEVATHSALAGLAYAALALLLTALSWAAPARADVPTQQVVLDARSIHIRRDLSFTEDHTRVVRILQPEAIEGFGKRRLSCARLQLPPKQPGHVGGGSFLQRPEDGLG
jgi:hypothetical protein